MTLKQNLVKIYNYLSQDPTILELMGLTGQSQLVIQKRIFKTKQVGMPADRYPRIGIWEPRTDQRKNNQLIYRHPLIIDIYVSLDDQQTKGLGADLGARVKAILDRKPVGMKIKHIGDVPDGQTAPGWYKYSVRFNYNSVGG